MKDLELKYPDPITGEKISRACWDNAHVGNGTYFPVCNGWREIGGRQSAPCECLCHDPQPQTVKTARKAQQAHTMDILETGCGTIEIK